MGDFMNDDMSNIAYTREYLEKFLDAYQKPLSPGCSVEEERQDFGNGISVLSKTSRYIYYRENSQFEAHLSRSENIVFRNGKEIYSFKTIDDDSRCKVFTHQNGHDYLFFKKDLYGYSILDLTDMRDFDYFPAASFPTGETFIWCEPFYNPINNIVAVDGCIWAGPYGIILADFTDPINSSRQIEASGYMEQFYSKNYYDFTFRDWNGTDLILWNGTGLFPERDENAEQKIIPSNEYMTWFKKDNNE